MKLPWFNGHNRFRNDLSAYVDGELRGAGARQLETHLKSCDSCRAELDELRLTVLAVRDLPEEPAPRSFALTPEQVAETPQPTPAGGVAYSPALNTGMRAAAGALAVALAVVLFVDVGDLGRDGDEVADPVRVTEDAGVTADEYGDGDFLGERSAPPYAPLDDSPEPAPAPTPHPIPPGMDAGPEPDAAPGQEPRPGTAQDVPEDRQPEDPASDVTSGDQGLSDPTFQGGERGATDPESYRAAQDDGEAPGATAAVDESSGPGALLIAQIGLAAALVMVLGALFVLSRMRAGARR